MFYLLLLLTIGISLCLVLLLYLYFQNILRTKNAEIKRLTIENSSLTTKLKQTDKIVTLSRRRAHRVTVAKVECLITFLNFKDTQFETLRNKEFKGFIEDISSTGLKFLCAYELPVKQNIQTKISFQVKDEAFQLIGKIMRREDHVNGNFIAYGVHFINISDKDKKRLQYIINLIESESNRDKTAMSMK